MAHIRTELGDFRLNIKERLCNVLVDIYKKQNNNLLPNWEEDEEIVVEPDETLYINLCVGNIYDENLYCSIVNIVELRVTLDCNLYVIDDNGNDICWTEISTDDLVELCYQMEFYLE